MYEYVDDKKTLGEIRSLCGHMMQDLCHTLKEKYNIGASFSLVGSGARNLVLQNKNEPIGYPFIKESNNFSICQDFQTNSLWIAGSKYLFSWILSSATFIVIGVWNDILLPP